MAGGESVLILMLLVLWPSSAASNTGSSERCHLPPQRGPCYGFVPSFFYDVKLQICRQFTYGGCGGNGNRFPTLSQCTDICQRSPSNSESTTTTTTTVCEGATRTISCPPTHHIDILTANYGRLSVNMCPTTSMMNTRCASSSADWKVGHQCNTRNACYVFASNDIFGDPCVGTFKYLQVQYKCYWQGHWRRTAACSRQRRTISCGERKTIKIIRTRSGRVTRRTRRRFCDHTTPEPEDDQQLKDDDDDEGRGCGMSDEDVRSHCDGRTTCTVCARWRRFLEVKYRCVRQTKETTNVTVCEHRRQKLTCPNEGKIFVMGATYGRQSRDTCPSPPMRKTDCTSASSEGKVVEMCDGRRSCSLHASNDVFGNPCPGTYKYLQVTYNCTNKEVPATTSTTTTTTTATATTKAKPTTTTTKAKPTTTTTKAKPTTTTTKAKPTTTTTKAKPTTTTTKAKPTTTTTTTTKAKPTTTTTKAKTTTTTTKTTTTKAKPTTTTTTTTGAPSTTATTTLQATTTTAKTTLQALICEHDTQIISCPANSTIHIMKSNYGRLVGGICPDVSMKDTHCSSWEAMWKVSDMCNMKTSCHLHASNEEFGNPCPGTFKYLQVKYKCIEADRSSSWKEITLCENERQKLTCPNDGKIFVMGATYGRQSRDTCPSPPMRKTDCTSASSEGKVVEMCDGQRSCSLHASNDVFGNPCPGTYKYLQVTYNCTNKDISVLRSLSTIGEKLVQGGNDSKRSWFTFALVPVLCVILFLVNIAILIKMILKCVQLKQERSRVDENIKKNVQIVKEEKGTNVYVIDHRLSEERTEASPGDEHDEEVPPRGDEPPSYDSLYTGQRGERC